MPSPPELLHQAFQPLPKLDAPLVYPDSGLITPPWYFLFMRLWQLLGASKLDFQDAQYVASPDPSQVNAIGSASGTVTPLAVGPAEEIIFQALEETPPGDPVPEVLGIPLGVPPDPGISPDSSWPIPQDISDLALDLLALGVPPDPPPVESTESWLLVVTGDVPVGIVCTPDGLPIYTRGTP